MSKRVMFCAVCGQVSLGLTYCSPKCKQKAYRNRQKQIKQAKARTIDMDTYSMQEKLIEVFGATTEFNLSQFYADFGKEAYKRMVHMTYNIFEAMAQEILEIS